MGAGAESVEIDASKLITDTLMHVHLLSKLPPLSTLVALVDACHCGRMFDTRFIWGTAAPAFENPRGKGIRDDVLVLTLSGPRTEILHQQWTKKAA